MTINSKTKSQVERQRSFPAVILAAGMGSRLKRGNGGIPKPLTPLLGLTLLERSILSCREAGVTEFYVIVGSQEEKIISHIQELKNKYSLSIQPIKNLKWKGGIGTSVLSAAPHVKGPFLLLMSDHLIDPGIIRCLLKDKSQTSCCLLAVDSHVENVFDLNDATKVKFKGDTLIDIGKDIVEFNGIDTGVFLCHSILFDALEKTRPQGGDSLSKGIRLLIQQGQMSVSEIGGQFWLDVDTPESLAYAKRTLLNKLSQPRDDGFISQYLNRPLSQKISELLVRTALTPNGITLLSFFFCLVGAILFAFGQYKLTLLAGLLIQFGSIIDGCDGEVARLRFQSSRFGGWIDTVLDRYADVFIGIGISYGFWRTFPNWMIWPLAIMALTGFILASYTKKEYFLNYGFKLPRGFISKLMKRDLRLFALMVGAIFNRPFEMMILIGLLSHFGIVWMILTVHKREWTTSH